MQASYANGALTSPKTGKGRSVPMVPEVAATLDALSRREHFTADDDRLIPARECN